MAHRWVVVEPHHPTALAVALQRLAVIAAEDAAYSEDEMLVHRQIDVEAVRSALATLATRLMAASEAATCHSSAVDVMVMLVEG